MRISFRTLLFLLFAVSPFAAEVMLRSYVSYVDKPARLFRSNSQTGWSNVPNRKTAHVNAAGEPWTIETDEHGHRKVAQPPWSWRRLLVLGDSLSFGEGVNVEDRFDVKMVTSLSGVRIINTGVSGYGTDQEYVAFQQWKHLLKPDDTVLLVLNRSDYFDVLRRRFFGRAKPRFEKVGNAFVLRAPPTELLERWSDWSLVAGATARLIGLPPDDPADKIEPGPSIEIIRFALSRIREEAPVRVRVVLAHEGSRDFLEPTLGISSNTFCEFADICIDLDNALTSPAHFLPDGHWTSAGHSAVAQALLEILRN